MYQYQYLEMKSPIGYDPIQFPIQYMETPGLTPLKIDKTSDKPQSAYKSKYLGLPSYQYLEMK